MKWLNSLDEFLYEVVSWLAFFPLTLWRVVRHPLAAMDYGETQLSLPSDEQFLDALSPPLLLVLTLLIAHGAGVALGQTDAIVANRHGLAGLISDDGTALVFRVLIFATLPLVMATRLIRRAKTPLNRVTLKGPFYAQCYPTAVFALTLSLGVSLTHVSGSARMLIGQGLLAAAFIFYFVVQTRWFARKLRTGWPTALGATALGVLEGFLIILLVGVLLAR